MSHYNCVTGLRVKAVIAAVAFLVLASADVLHAQGVCGAIGGAISNTAKNAGGAISNTAKKAGGAISNSAKKAGPSTKHVMNAPQSAAPITKHVMNAPIPCFPQSVQSAGPVAKPVMSATKNAGGQVSNSSKAAGGLLGAGGSAASNYSRQASNAAKGGVRQGVLPQAETMAQQQQRILGVVTRTPLNMGGVAGDKVDAAKRSATTKAQQVVRTVDEKQTAVDRLVTQKAGIVVKAGERYGQAAVDNGKRQADAIRYRVVTEAPPNVKEKLPDLGDNTLRQVVHTPRDLQNTARIASTDLARETQVKGTFGPGGELGPSPPRGVRENRNRSLCLTAAEKEDAKATEHSKKAKAFAQKAYECKVRLDNFTEDFPGRVGEKPTAQMLDEEGVRLYTKWANEQIELAAQHRDAAKRLRDEAKKPNPVFKEPSGNTNGENGVEDGEEMKDDSDSEITPGQDPEMVSGAFVTKPGSSAKQASKQATKQAKKQNTP